MKQTLPRGTAAVSDTPTETPLGRGWTSIPTKNFSSSVAVIVCVCGGGGVCVCVCIFLSLYIYKYVFLYFFYKDF